ncbi:hypothetical protein E2C01_067387 [Portunus trituberculatus]|uniref:Uncharacterized protein n=1 Tax=Portunus trituberculatus TaxID=210409 RepID=A0A5B7HTG8_PORTR|nr:hypothetical protein [Portunus trituberculatus]
MTWTGYILNLTSPASPCHPQPASASHSPHVRRHTRPYRGARDPLTQARTAGLVGARGIPREIQLAAWEV